MLKHLVPICASLVIPININRSSRMHSENTWYFIEFYYQLLYGHLWYFQSYLLRCNTSIFLWEKFQVIIKGLWHILNRITIVTWLTFHSWGLKASSVISLTFRLGYHYNISPKWRLRSRTIRCKYPTFYGSPSLKCIPKREVRLLGFKLIYSTISEAVNGDNNFSYVNQFIVKVFIKCIYVVWKLGLQ